MRKCSLGWLILPLVAMSCTTTSTTAPKVLKNVENTPEILVVKSSDNPQLDVVIDNFVAQAPAKVSLLSLASTSDDDVVSYLEAKPAALVFTLGSRATILVRKRLPKQPLIFSMVLSYHRLDLGGTQGLMGISLEPAPATELTQFKMVAPDIKGLTVFYNPGTTEKLIADANAAAETLGLKLVNVKITSLDELKAKFSAATKDTDGVWLVADPIVMNEEAFAFLLDSTKRSKKLLLASFSGKFAEAGAVMALSVDLNSLGAQAAAMTSQFLQGTRAEDIGIATPIGGRLFVNRNSAKAIALQIPEDALPYFEFVGLEPSAALR